MPSLVRVQASDLLFQIVFKVAEPLTRALEPIFLKSLTCFLPNFGRDIRSDFSFSSEQLDGLSIHDEIVINVSDCETVELIYSRKIRIIMGLRILLMEKKLCVRFVGFASSSLRIIDDLFAGIC